MKSASKNLNIDNVNSVLQCKTIVNKDPLWGMSTSIQLDDKIPNEINISNLSIIENYKLARYIFPKHDHGPKKAGLQVITPVQSLMFFDFKMLRCKFSSGLAVGLCSITIEKP